MRSDGPRFQLFGEPEVAVPGNPSADSLRWNLDLAVDQRGADMADLPGGASGMLVRNYRGKEGDRLVTRIDPVVVSLAAELRAHQRQAAEELGQWKTHHEECKVIDASRATITLAVICAKTQMGHTRVAALQKRWDRLRAGLDPILDQRGRGHGRSARRRQRVPGARLQGKKADRLVLRIDPGVVSLVAELRGHERRAAEELGHRKTHHEERKLLDASPSVVTLAVLLTDDELDSLEKGVGDGEIAGRGRPGGADVASPQPAACHGEPAQVFPANAAASDRRTGMDGRDLREWEPGESGFPAFPELEELSGSPQRVLSVTGRLPANQQSPNWWHWDLAPEIRQAGPWPSTLSTVPIEPPDDRSGSSRGRPALQPTFSKRRTE